MRRLPLDHPGTPDHRSPARLLWWMARQQWRTLAGGMAFGVVWMCCSAVMPAVIGKAIDVGVSGRDMSALVGWGAVLLGIGVLGAAAGIMRHRFAVTNWLTAAYRVVQLITRHATYLGATLPRKVSTGEVVSIGTNDLSYIGNLMDVSARTAGALVSFVVVATILLRTSVTLGLLVLVGMPVLLLALAPLLRPLQARNLDQREMMGQLANLATDIVTGLRMLRGIGGERVFHGRYAEQSQRVRRAGVRVVALQSVLDALQVLLPGLFVVLVVWVGARFAVQRRISPGELVAFYGYAAFLLLPLRTATEFANKSIRAYVAARRIVHVLAIRPEIADPESDGAADAAVEPSVDDALVDVASGVRVTPGLVTALVSEPPEDAARVADRLGRFADGEVHWGPTTLADLPRAVVRRRIVVSDTGAMLFAGTLGEQIDVHARGTSALQRALDAASADDVLDALPGGLHAEVAEKGRSFSGGQRQRLVLARAVAADPEVLVLVEPTSAVDAHTEARIADRLRDARAGRTTVVTTTSPLMLDRVDRVCFLHEGRVVAEGSHAELVAGTPAYRAVVTREAEETVLVSTSQPRDVPLAERVMLPVADPAVVRGYVTGLFRRHPRELGWALGLQLVAAVAGLAGPRLLGDLVEGVQTGTTLHHVNVVVLWLAGFLVLQTLFTRQGRFLSGSLGEQVLAELREDFVDAALDLPIGTVESAGSGDLLTRTSRDIEQLGFSVRWALPEWVNALITMVVTLVGTLLMGAWVLLPVALGVPVLVVGLRWYLARAKDGYLRESASYTRINASLTETVEGARTVEALGLEQRRIDQVDDDIARSYAAERYTLGLRTRFFPSMEVAYLIPTVATLVFGGWLYMRGDVSLGAVTTATLYVQALVGPLDVVVSILDELQVGAASLARLLGVSQVPDDRVASGAEPQDEHLRADDVRFAYVEGRDVLHGVDLDIGVGERIAMVGPSGAGKSTLGRLLAGIHGPRTGSVTVGGVGLTELPIDDLRRRVALVTQEHHVFVGTLRDNLALAAPPGSLAGTDDQRLLDVLESVDAREWVVALPQGLDTVVGAGGRELTPAQAQQLALARLVLADPHTLVLDEATSLIDPRAARHLERSLAAVLEGRTVIAIAHRLFSAHDADRVAVVEDGRIAELGSHDELVAAGGSYARLWESWHR